MELILVAIDLFFGLDTPTPLQPATLDDVTPLLPQNGSNLTLAPNFQPITDPALWTIAGVTVGGATTGVLATVRGAFPAPLTLAQIADFPAQQAWVQTALNVVITEALVVGEGFRMDIDFEGAQVTARQLGVDWTFDDLLALDPTINGEPLGGGGDPEPEPGQTIAGDDNGNTLDGGDGPDTISGGDGDDTVTGGATGADLADIIDGGAGNDSINGGAGNDSISGGTGGDTLIGGLGSDTLAGNADDDVLSGGGLSDMIFGGAGDDFVNGGFGFDRINGGEGADTFFHLGIADHGSDWIQDFSDLAGDILQLAISGATADDFVIQFAETEGAGEAGVSELFVVYAPTGQILWALVDGGALESLVVDVAGAAGSFDLLAA